MKDLKHLYYFEKLLEDANNELVRQAQSEGLKCIATTCENVPEPLLNLPGIFSVRLRAPRTGSMEMATYYMTSFLCEYSRALLERAIEGGYNFVDGIVTPDGCTMMNRCVENMELLKTMGEGKDGFFWEYMEIPQKNDDNALEMYTLQCRNHILKPLAEKYGITGICNFADVFSNPVDTLFDYLRGFKGTLTDLRRQPDKVKAACDRLWETYNLPKLQGTPAPFPYACHMTHIAPYLSPKQFYEIYWPYEKFWIERAAAAGTKVWIMLEGRWENVWECFKEVPKDSCILHIDDDDIIKAKEVLGDYQIIEGGLKMASVRTDSPEKIKDDVKKIIDACQPGDGFLFCTDKAWIAPGDVNQNLIDAYNFAHEYSLSRTQK